MNKIILSIAFSALFGSFASAQKADLIGTLPCRNPNTQISQVNFIDIKRGDKGQLNLDVNWGGKSGGSTLTPANLQITNGVIQSFKPVGQIGANNTKQTWVLKVTDINKAVSISWNTKGTIDMCGSQRAIIGIRDLK